MWTAEISPNWPTFAICSTLISFAIFIEKQQQQQQQAVELANKPYANYGKKFLNNILPPLQTPSGYVRLQYTHVYIKSLLYLPN